MEIRNGSRTPTPVPGVFGPDKRFLSFGPNSQEQGAGQEQRRLQADRALSGAMLSP
jgi:hypothetical protein